MISRLREAKWIENDEKLCISCLEELRYPPDQRTLEYREGGPLYYLLLEVEAVLNLARDIIRLDQEESHVPRP